MHDPPPFGSPPHTEKRVSQHIVPGRPPLDAPGFALRTVRAHDIDIHVATAGAGPPVLLLHGWPHTWLLWRHVLPALARDHCVIAPDLRGLGGSTKTDGGYDLYTLADDAAALLDALGVPPDAPATIVGIDLGAPVAWMLAMRHPARVARLVVMESLLGTLPGAERFLANGPPWWFGFHGAPGLAETVLQGHEAEYLDWFYTSGTKDGRGIDADTRAAFAAAYTGREALRGGFAHYRSLPVNARQIAATLAERPMTVPTLALEGGVVGDALSGQLRPVARDLATERIADCGHLIPLEQPDALVNALRRFFRPAA